MKRCSGNTYLRQGDQLFVYDSLWTSFRPVRRVVWNSETRQVEPFYGDLTADCLDPFYGFGTSEMEDRCIELTDKYIDNLESAEDLDSDTFWKWSHQPMIWVRDRGVCCIPCDDPEKVWKSYATKHKTRRRAPASFDWRATKRRIR